MAAVAVRKKVVSIGHFLPSFYFQTLHFFYLLYQIKSNCIYWLHWKSRENGTEPSKLDELKYSKSLNQISSYAHWNAFLYLHAQLKHLFILLKVRKTRPDTRPIPVANAWAEAEMRVFKLDHHDRRTDQRTDQRTYKASYRVACPRLKRCTRVFV